MQRKKTKKQKQTKPDRFASIMVYLYLSSTLTLRALKCLHTHKQADVQQVEFTVFIASVVYIYTHINEVVTEQ